MHTSIKGAAAGFAATLPMTAAMAGMHTLLPEEEQYALPPREITMNIAEQTGIRRELSEEQKTAATFVSHFGYGSAMGMMYGAFFAETKRPLTTGMAFGLGVYTVSYFGLLPATGLLAPPTRHPIRRTGLVIAAHLIWGAALGLLVEALNDKPVSRRITTSQSMADELIL